MEQVGLDLGLAGKHVLVTGGAGFIGSHVVSAFLTAGARVTCLDVSSKAMKALAEQLQDHDYGDTAYLHMATADITDEARLEKAFEHAASVHGPIHCCVALASLDLSVLERHASICDVPSAQFRRTHEVNVLGTFLTARTWARGLRAEAGRPGQRRLSNPNLIIVGSESGAFGERGHPDYASAKSAVQVGLLQSLKQDLPRIYPGARVNAVAPGPVETPQFRRECRENPRQLYHDAEATTALGRPVSMAAVAKTVVYLASDLGADVHGQVVHVDGGKQGKLVFEEGEAAQFR